MAFSDKNKTIVKDKNELYKHLISDYPIMKVDVLSRAKERVINEEEFADDIRRHINGYYICDGDFAEAAVGMFVDYIYGYSILTPLINDPEVSDIRLLAYDNVRVKKKGQRMSTNVKFESLDDYKKFIDYVITRNHINASNLNAIQRFTDDESNKNSILRFTLAQPLVNTYKWPILSIRKVPRDFPLLDDLVKEQMLSDELKDILIDRFSSGSTIVCGGNSSGKTTILNALKETLPHDVSVLVAQQADELTTKSHPDITFMHSLPGSSESDAVYDLKNISIAGLTMDIDFFIVGEVKGDEARYLLNAAYTGQKCACTIHAPSADKAINKIIDYAMGDGYYTKQELLRMMDCFQTVIFMEKYKVKQVYAIRGYNYQKNEIDYYPIFENGKLLTEDSQSDVFDV